MIRIAAILALSSCSATATIAEETNTVRARATSAQKHLAVVEADLHAIQAAAAEVHAALPGAEDERSQLLDTIQYVFIGGGVMAGCALTYYLINRFKK
jgi:hypothetical protein